jgi:hypothetical protein
MLVFIVAALTGANALAASCYKQDFVAKSSMTVSDLVDGNQIDVTKVIVGDDGSIAAFQVTAAKAYDQKLLAGQHIYFFLDTDQNAKTGVYSPNYGMGIDRVIEIGYLEDKGKQHLFATVHNGRKIFGTSLSVGFDGTNLTALVPRRMLDVWGNFNWKMQLFSEKQGDYKAYDAVPDKGYATYELYVSAGSYSDIEQSDWFYANVDDLISKDIVNGYSDGTFKPKKNITRAEFCKVLMTALGESPSLATSSYSDTKSHWARGYIEAAKELNIASGYPNGDFRPESNITRAEIAKMIATAQGFSTTDTASGFSDCKGYWADQYIAVLKSSSIITGYQDETFRPLNYATRAEVCKIISTMLAVNADANIGLTKEETVTTGTVN